MLLKPFFLCHIHAVAMGDSGIPTTSCHVFRRVDVQAGHYVALVEYLYILPSTALQEGPTCVHKFA